MEAKKGFYITTPIFYPNAKLHMGHAYTAVLCDSVARFHRSRGEDTYFLSGADEHSEKVVRAAAAAGVPLQEYLDRIVENFHALYALLDVSIDQFIRTTDQTVHWPGAQEMWRRMVAAGDIYKATYRGWYCVGAESFVQEKDLRAGGLCPDHDEKPVLMEEENYFFRLSKYAPLIADKITRDELRIVPETRKREILSFIAQGVEDISFSRPREKVTFGIPVPDDPSHRMYVWCDALANYITALGYGREDTALFQTFWPADYHVIGKDILRFHAVVWPAMLLSANLPLPRHILVHGMITSGGRKMSKSLGNVIDPMALVEAYGTDAVRYYLLREISPFEDGDLTVEKFHEVYHAHLANGLGNTVARITAMASQHLEAPPEVPLLPLPARYVRAFEACDVKTAADYVWEEIAALDRTIQETQPFKLVRIDRTAAQEVLRDLVVRLAQVGRLLAPLLPRTAAAIAEAVRANTKPPALFARKEALPTLPLP